MYGLRYYCFSLYVLHSSVICSFITVAMHCICLVIKEKWKQQKKRQQVVHIATTGLHMVSLSLCREAPQEGRTSLVSLEAY